MEPAIMKMERTIEFGFKDGFFRIKTTSEKVASYGEGPRKTRRQRVRARRIPRELLDEYNTALAGVHSRLLQRFPRAVGDVPAEAGGEERAKDALESLLKHGEITIDSLVARMLIDEADYNLINDQVGREKFEDAIRGIMHELQE